MIAMVFDIIINDKKTPEYSVRLTEKFRSLLSVFELYFTNNFLH